MCVFIVSFNNDADGLGTLRVGWWQRCFYLGCCCCEMQKAVLRLTHAYSRWCHWECRIKLLRFIDYVVNVPLMRVYKCQMWRNATRNLSVWRKYICNNFVIVHQNFSLLCHSIIFVLQSDRIKWKRCSVKYSRTKTKIKQNKEGLSQWTVCTLWGY